MIQFVRSVVFTGFLHQQSDCYDIAKLLLKVALNTINPLSLSSDDINASSIWDKITAGNQTIVYINRIKKEYFY
jgi:hypothetical protein